MYADLVQTVLAVILLPSGVDCFPILQHLGLPSGAFTDEAISAYLHKFPALTTVDLSENSVLKFGEGTFTPRTNHAVEVLNLYNCRLFKTSQSLRLAYSFAVSTPMLITVIPHPC